MERRGVAIDMCISYGYNQYVGSKFSLPKWWLFDIGKMETNISYCRLCMIWGTYDSKSIYHSIRRRPLTSSSQELPCRPLPHLVCIIGICDL